MVSFSCEVCNDTVIKKKLDQHQQRCYGAYFTCIDCSTTFSGSDHRAHTSCISEAEKYEKALYKGPQKKQNNKTKSITKEVRDTVKSLPIKSTESVEGNAVDTEKLTPVKKLSDKNAPWLEKHLSHDKKSMYKVLKKASKKEKLEIEAVLKRLNVQIIDGKILVTETD